VLQQLGREIREARVAAGLSQATVARAAGMSPPQLGRIERSELRFATFEQACRAGRAVGLATYVNHSPTGTRVRDEPQLRLLAALEQVLAPPLRMPREVLLPMPGDLRAWDGSIDDGRERAFVEGVTRLGDIQAMARRTEIKLRDDGRSRIVILVIRRTATNRRILDEHREALRVQFPLDGPQVLRALRAGRLPSASGIVLL